MFGNNTKIDVLTEEKIKDLPSIILDPFSSDKFIYENPELLDDKLEKQV
jgi:hypothetical protein